MEEKQNAVDWLREEFSARRSSDSSYSLRAFAKQLETAPGPLSEILNGHRNVTHRMGRRMVDKLSWDAAKSLSFLEQIKKDKERRHGERGQQGEFRAARSKEIIILIPHSQWPHLEDTVREFVAQLQTLENPHEPQIRVLIRSRASEM